MPGKRNNSDDLIDQSKLVNKRARRRIKQSCERIERTKHAWVTIAAGRVCTTCRTSQAKGDFDDAVPCREQAG